MKCILENLENKMLYMYIKIFFCKNGSVVDEPGISKEVWATVEAFFSLFSTVLHVLWVNSDLLKSCSFSSL